MITDEARDRVYQMVRACPTPLAKHATNRVPWRGTVAEGVVVFVGEAPGPQEDLQGLPFVGPAGELLQRWLDHHIGLLSDGWLLTNVVCCVPRDAPDGKFRPPTGDEMMVCWPHVEALLALVKPGAVVAVGSVAEKWLARRQVPHHHVLHPSWFRRTGSDWRPHVAALGDAIRRSRRIAPRQEAL